MFERSISPDEVLQLIESGEVIEGYPDDQPYPSVLLYAHVKGKILHAVVASDSATGDCYVITVYVPDAAIWSDDFRSRR